MSTEQYVHGYDPQESSRLHEQAANLSNLLHQNTDYPVDSKILEIGCAVGAQSAILAKNNPESHITAVDLSEPSIAEAKRIISEKGFNNVTFVQKDLTQLDFEPESFDHLFGSFILEHLLEPVEVLRQLKTHLKVGGTVTIIEGDHGSAHFYPDSESAHKVIQCQVALQKSAGGNANIGRELYPLLSAAGFNEVTVTPLVIYLDHSQIKQRSDFIGQLFTPMIEGVRDAALQAGLIDEATFDQGIIDLYRLAEPDGVFCFTFYSVTAKR